MASFEELTPREEEIKCGSTSLNYGIVGCGRQGILHAQIILSQCQEIVAIADESKDEIAHFFSNLSGCIDSAPGDQKINTNSGGVSSKLYKTLVPNEKTLERGKNIAEDAIFSSAEQLASAHKDGKIPKLDAVLICSDAHRHTRDAEPFVRLGVKVFIDSPFAADLADAFDFIKNVGSDASLMQVGMKRRFDDAISHARQLMSEGRLGTVREVRVCVRTQFSPASLSCSKFTVGSLGVMRDLGLEGVDTFLHLTGGSEFPTKISAVKFEAKDSAPKNTNSSNKNSSPSSSSSTNSNDNTAYITFTTSTGVVGRIELAQGTASSGPVNAIEVVGSKGSVSIDRFTGYPGPIHVELWKEDNTKDNLGSKSFDMNTRLRPKIGQNSGDETAPQCCDNTFFDESLPRFQAAYRAMHTAFRDDVVLKRPFKVSSMDVLDAQVVVEAAVLSAERGGVAVEVKRPSQGGGAGTGQGNSNLDEYHNNCRKAGLC